MPLDAALFALAILSIVVVVALTRLTWALLVESLQFRGHSDWPPEHRITAVILIPVVWGLYYALVLGPIWMVYQLLG